MMSLANARMVKVRNTASRKMAVVFRGAFLQMLTAFSESGLSFLFSKWAPNEIRFDFPHHREAIAAGRTRNRLLPEDETPHTGPAVLAHARSSKSILFGIQQA
jgi:hypothetical protein